jgi:anti-sigma B factor antagonist
VNDDEAWRLEVAREPEHTVLRVTGDLDLETAPQMLAAIEPYLAAGAEPLVLDLCELAFIDSSGLSALIRVNQRMAAADRPLTILSPAPPVAKVFEITGLDQVLPVRPGPV